MTDLVQIDQREASLPAIKEVAAEVARLIEARDAGQLGHARSVAEAQALFEKRSGHIERERFFCKLKMLAEAGLGVISWDHPELLEARFSHVGEWRTLAAAFERNQLMNFLQNEDLRPYQITFHIRIGGWTYAEVDGKEIPWARARERLRADGIPFYSVPPAAEYMRRRDEELAERSRRRHKENLAQERLERIQARSRAIGLAKGRGPKITKAYSLLRQSLQALHEAQGEFTKEERRDNGYGWNGLSVAISSMYEAEDALIALLGAWQEPEEGKE